MLQNSQIREDCAARDNLADSLGAGREGRLARSSAIWLASPWTPKNVWRNLPTLSSWPQYTEQSRVGNDLTGYAGTLYVDKGYVCNGKKSRLKFRV